MNIIYDLHKLTKDARINNVSLWYTIRLNDKKSLRMIRSRCQDQEQDINQGDTDPMGNCITPEMLLPLVY